MDPNLTPAMAPPPGVTSNFENPAAMHGWSIAAVSLCLSAAIISICLRTFVKAVIMRHVEVEDYVLIFAGMAFTSFIGVSMASNHAGDGKHLWNISIAGVQHLAGLENLSMVLYGVVLCPAKLSVLLQMQRLFRGTQRDSIFWTIQGLMWSNLLFYIATTIAFACSCIPRAKMTNPDLPGRCIDSNALILCQAIINSISDVMILTLPVFAVWKLHMAIKKKLFIAAVFGSGIFACISSFARLGYIVLLRQVEDFTGNVLPVCMWGYAELCAVILAGAFPVFPRLFQWLAQRPLLSSLSFGKGKSSRSSYLRQSKKGDVVGGGSGSGNGQIFRQTHSAEHPPPVPDRDKNRTGIVYEETEMSSSRTWGHQRRPSFPMDLERAQGRYVFEASAAAAGRPTTIPANTARVDGAAAGRGGIFQTVTMETTYRPAGS